MGVYYLVVNPAKKQYMNPGRFGEAIKFRGMLDGSYCQLALKLLIVDSVPRGSTRNFGSAWLCDPIILAGDDTGSPNPCGIPTATPDRPWRNLNKLAHDEYTDISYRAIAELCLYDNDIIGELIERAKDDSSFFIDLTNVQLQYRLPALEHAFLEAFGKSWRKKYDQGARECHWWQPLPPIDWPL